MTTITLSSIRAEQQRLNKLIETFVAQGSTDYRVPEADIDLRQGEHYAGLILDENGNPSHHLILLPGEAAAIKWQAARDWAAEQGGELPTRREQSLLFANLPGHFQSTWYWSSEKHEDDPSYAWNQTFYDGGQHYYEVGAQCRARAVRRLVIE